MDSLYIAIQNKALSYLARREHSTKELRIKLAQHCADPTLIQDVLAKLESKGYLNQQRFIESRIRHRLRQGYGALRIKQELLQVHGCHEHEVQVVLAELTTDEDHNELTQLRHLIAKKYPDFDPHDKTAAQKIIKKLLQRGFSYDLIRQLQQTFSK
jgi:regulatory protein